MKQRAILSGQSVKNRKGADFSWVLRGLALIGSLFLRFSTLTVILIVISLLFVCVYEYVLTSPYVRLEQVLVTGVDEDLKNELLGVANLEPNVSLLAVNLQELKDRLEKHPWVRSVELEKSFPHTLVIKAEKEEPWAMVLTDRLSYVNGRGEVFKEVEEGEALDYPLITGIVGSGEGKERQIYQALHVLRTLQSERSPWSLKELSEVHTRRDGTVSLYFSSVPWMIRVREGELEGRMVDLKRMVEHLNSTGRIHMVRGINLDYQDGAVVLFRKG